MMLHVNESMLIHSATWLEESAPLDNPAIGSPVVYEHLLSSVRLGTLSHGISYQQTRVERADEEILLYFVGASKMDGAKTPLPAFKEGERIRLQNGEEKVIKEVVEFYGASKLHHLEVKLQ